MEQNFILAEAALRGWINGSAEEYYKKGIRASMEFIAQYTPAGETYNHGKEITAEYIDQYLAQPNVQLDMHPMKKQPHRHLSCPQRASNSRTGGSR